MEIIKSIKRIIQKEPTILCPMDQVIPYKATKINDPHYPYRATATHPNGSSVEGFGVSAKDAKNKLLYEFGMQCIALEGGKSNPGCYGVNGCPKRKSNLQKT